jgi:roundabout axon guidance receptor 2
MPLGRVKVLDDRSLRLDNVVLEDEGEYSCEAENSVGAVSATGYLTVYGEYCLVRNCFLFYAIEKWFRFAITEHF